MPPKPAKPPIRIPAQIAKATPRAVRLPPFKARPTTTSHTSNPLKSPHSPPPYQTSKPKSLLSNPLVRFTAYTVIGASTLIWLRDHHVDFMRVRGVSMSPTLNAQFHETGATDVVLIRPCGDGDELRRGDVVTFWKPRDARALGIKRVVGVEGDEVCVGWGYAVDADAGVSGDEVRDGDGEGKGREGIEYLKGIPDGLHDFDEDSIASERREKGRIVVPYGHIWVEGDNARCTLDSRDNGPICTKLVVGRAVRVWRGWSKGFQEIGDGRSVKERAGGSRVKQGRGSEVPDIFLE